MWKDILVHVDGSPAGRLRVDYALSLAQQSGARLCGLHVEPPVEIPPVYRPIEAEHAAVRIQNNLDLDAELAEGAFFDATKGTALETNWRSSEGDVAARICEHARYADLVILGQYEHVGSPERHPLSLAASVVNKCGRPILLVPAHCKPIPKKPRILLAWDGAFQTVRAMHDALPLLQRGDGLRVISVNPEQEDLGGDMPYRDSLADHLRRHDVTVKEHIVARGAGSQSELIGRHLRPENFDLLVMGAYAHPMWFEFLFGGVTQSVMRSSSIAVLMSH